MSKENKVGYEAAADAAETALHNYCSTQNWSKLREGEMAHIAVAAAYPIIVEALVERTDDQYREVLEVHRQGERGRILELLRNTKNIGVMEPSGADWASYIESELS